MNGVFFLLSVLQLLATATGEYKQWVPNTNFETSSNWDKGRVPCASNVVHFEKNKVVSVFVRSPHVLAGMSICEALNKQTSWTGKYLPLNGEFILASGAGFAASDGSWDPGCDSGGTVRFSDTEQRAWFDPALWQAVSPGGKHERSRRLFSVDEERVPCQYDDVIFLPETSFRVDISSSQQVIRLRSISLMGQELNSPEAWAGYLRGPSASLQFHGNGTLQVMGSGCPDKSGCACGNTLDGHRICTALLKASGGQCPAPNCQSPLQPLGHCCRICGAIVNLDFTPDFELQKYRDRLVQTFLSQPRYSSVQMAISKVQQAQTLLGVIPRGSSPLIQIVLIDHGEGAQTGTMAAQLAADIMEDIAHHGETLGVSHGKVEVATGSTSSGQVGSRTLSKTTAGMVMGLLFGLLFLGGIFFLYRRGKPRLPTLRIPHPWNRAKDPLSPEPAGDKGFNNPMFNVEPPSTYPGEETPQEMVPKDLQVFYLNPLYDEGKTDI